MLFQTLSFSFTSPFRIEVEIGNICGGFPDDNLFQSNIGNNESQSNSMNFFVNTSTINSSNGSSLDYSSTFVGSGISDSNAYTYDDDGDDIFGLKKAKSDDVYGSFVSPPEKSD
ncbi:hypothetical protein WN944_006745 [Citrus x changshan-huyou]|uniref:Uncharacterized protein n=1 Tax=Citrus x changshan-huyou TaxID=2935761 RepID=A0AAP0MPI9_9ROSI